MRWTLLILLAISLLACGRWNADKVAESSDASSVLSPLSPLSRVVSQATLPDQGEYSIEERILNSASIVKARLTSHTAEVVEGAREVQGQHFIFLKFHLTVSEYLMGSGPTELKAVGIQYDASYETQEAALAAIPAVQARRDTQWDNREAIFFLMENKSTEWFGNYWTANQSDTRYFSYAGVPWEDNYSLSSTSKRLWLPADASSVATGDAQKFLLAVPQPNTTTPTITLGDLKTRIASVAAELNQRRRDG